MARSFPGFAFRRTRGLEAIRILAGRIGWTAFYEQAAALERRLAAVQIVTTDEVLTESTFWQAR
ncbi:MAG: hypothetical protein GY953_19345 [bacterium]|nr:hypothetical protein [bacterium]